MQLYFSKTFSGEKKETLSFAYKIPGDVHTCALELPRQAVSAIPVLLDNGQHMAFKSWLQVQMPVL